MLTIARIWSRANAEMAGFSKEERPLHRLVVGMDLTNQVREYSRFVG